MRKISDVAVRISAKESTTLTRLRAAPLLRSSCHNTSSVRMLAGMLPLASRITAGQWMLRAMLCTMLPPVLVAAAYSRSVPTAVEGWMPNSRINNGVISEPPPTPVMPTKRPTPKPDAI